jgi:TRAP-type uncharacterized transport system substrate-binding protein
MNVQGIEANVEGRFRRMLRHTWLVVIAAILATIGLGALAVNYANRPTTLIAAVGPPNSDDVKIIQAFAQQFARERASVRLRVAVKESAVEAAAAIDKHEADLAVVRRDRAMPQGAQAVAILRKNVVVIAAPPPPAPAPAAGKGKSAKKTAAKDKEEEEDEEKAPAKGKAKKKGKATAKDKDAAKSTAKDKDKDKDKDKAKEDEDPKKIEKIEDLAGKRLAVIGRSGSNVNLLNIILRQYGIPLEKVQVVQLETTDVGPAIRDSKVDAIMSVGPVGSRITADAVAAISHEKEPPTFLAIDASEAIVQRNPVYESIEIPAGAFGGAPQRPPEAVETIGFSHYIVARKTLDETTVGDLARLLFTARQTLAGDIPSIGKIEAPDTDKDAAVAVHPGAAAYIDGEQKTFFDRYNDWIYYGLMIFSFFGSAMAWLINYSKTNNEKAAQPWGGLDRLLELMRMARTATEVAALDQLQAEADEILVATMRDVEAGAVDQPKLQAFTVMLDQARLAIAERREGLAESPPVAAATPKPESSTGNVVSVLYPPQAAP